ncbi:MAG: flagellar biosynthetic protein FliR [Spirochaetes bacterium]|nr:flagellar biosynthetic protein FliR [Spirochaetota bacterium]
MDYFVQYFQVFLLIMVRMLAMFIAAPFFSSGVIPLRIRTVTALYVSVCVFPMVARTIGEVPESMFLYALMIGSEALIGVLIGFMMSIVFAAFQLAARLFSFQMALGISEVIDPISQVGITMIGQLWVLMGILIFIAIDGPHYLIMATYDSYSSVQLFDILRDNRAVVQVLIRMFGAMFLVALKLSFPILITLFLLVVTLGMLAKAAPQMNVFMVGFPIQIAVGLIVMIAAIGAIAFGMSSSIQRAFDEIFRIIHVIGR